MVQNLKTKTYTDGTPIPEIMNSQEWFLNGEARFSWYNNSKDEETTIFGALYNWYGVESGKLCPEGWHIPTLDEFTELVRFTGGESSGGIHLKSTEF